VDGLGGGRRPKVWRPRGLASASLRITQGEAQPLHMNLKDIVAGKGPWFKRNRFDPQGVG